MEKEYFLVGVAVFFAVSLVIVVVIIRRLLIVVMPNELVILIGRRYKAPDGRVVAYRVLTGGRVIRIPFIERADRMSRGPYAGELDMKEVFTRDGARLRIQGPVEVHISSHTAEIGNAVERFAGSPPERISHAAVETLEGHLRAILANTESEAAVHDPLDFQRVLIEESEEDLRKLGLVVSTCNATAAIQHPPPARGKQAGSASQRLLDRLADRDLPAEAKQAAVQAMGAESFNLLVKVDRTNPPSLGELPDDYRVGQAAYGLAPNNLEVEVVYPAERAAEVALLEGGGLEVPVVVRALRWDGPRQCLVVLAV